MKKKIAKVAAPRSRYIEVLLMREFSIVSPHIPSVSFFSLYHTSVARVKRIIKLVLKCLSFEAVYVVFNVNFCGKNLIFFKRRII